MKVIEELKDLSKAPILPENALGDFLSSLLYFYATLQPN